MIEAYDRVGSQAVRAFEPGIGAKAPSDSDRAIAVRMAVVLGRVPPPVAKCPSADVLGAQIKSDAAQAVQLYERAERPRIREREPRRRCSGSRATSVFTVRGCG